jgi:hypothetical protein
MSSPRPERTAPRAPSPPVWSSTLPSWAAAPGAPKRWSRGLLGSVRVAGLLRRRRVALAPTCWTCSRCGAMEQSAQAAAIHVQDCRPAGAAG